MFSYHKSTIMNIICNISILSLSSKLISKSPFICNTYTSSFREIDIQKSNFLNYINSLYYSFDINTKFKISSSQIQNFLDQAICITKDLKYSNQKILNQISSIKTPFEPIYVEKCNFISVKAKSSSGGAILSFSPLKVDDTTFIKCSTIRGGGAIASYSAVYLNNVYISQCKGLFSSCIFLDSYDLVDAHFNHLSAQQCSSPMSEGAITITSTNFLFHNSNLSYCETQGFYCGIWIDKSNVKMTFSSIIHITNPDINGGITSIDTFSFFVDRTAFLDLSLKAKTDFGAVSIYVDRNRNQNSSVSNCIFNYKDTFSPSIYVRMGKPVMVKFCCFSAKEIYERKTAYAIFDKSNSFGFTCIMDETATKETQTEKISKTTQNKWIFYEKFHLIYYLTPFVMASLLSFLFLFF